MHVKGFAAPETKAAEGQARLLVEKAEALGEKPPLGLLSILYGFWMESFAAFDGDACRNLAAQMLALAEKQGTTVSIMIGHTFLGMSLAATGDIVEGQTHFDQAIRLYDPIEHRPLTTRFGVDVRVQILSYRSVSLWMLGYPEAALTDIELALKYAREIGHTVTLMNALVWASLTHICCRSFATANATAAELMALGTEKDFLSWKAGGIALQGFVLAGTGKGLEALEMITSGWAAYQSTGGTLFTPGCLSYLARAHADIGQFHEARRCIGEAITVVEKYKEKWWEAEIHRVAGEIALRSPERDAPEAQACFERALEIARTQQSRSWELRAAMSLAQLWRDQGKRREAHDLLAPVYGWFTEGFDTLDLKEAKALLEELA